MDDGGKAKQAAFSVLTGMFVGAAWWIFIDGYIACPDDLGCNPTSQTKGFAWIPLALATVVFVMINGMKWSELRDDITGDSKTAVKARIFLLFAMLIAIAALAASAYIMSHYFLQADTGYKWSGISAFVGTMMILAASFFMRFITLPPPEFA